MDPTTSFFSVLSGLGPQPRVRPTLYDGKSFLHTTESTVSTRLLVDPCFMVLDSPPIYPKNISHPYWGVVTVSNSTQIHPSFGHTYSLRFIPLLLKKFYSNGLCLTILCLLPQFQVPIFPEIHCFPHRVDIICMDIIMMISS